VQVLVCVCLCGLGVCVCVLGRVYVQHVCGGGLCVCVCMWFEGACVQENEIINKYMFSLAH
jgi:hypothetical protein